MTLIDVHTNASSPKERKDLHMQKKEKSDSQYNLCLRYTHFFLSKASNLTKCYLLLCHYKIYKKIQCTMVFRGFLSSSKYLEQT